MIEEKLDLLHKEKIDNICRKYSNCSSSHSFASMYIWRENFGHNLCMGHEMFSLKCDAKGKNSWFFPCGESEEKAEFIREKMQEKDFSLCYIRESDIEFLHKIFPGRFILEERPEDSEYIYDRELWERLEGRKYATLRNHIRRAIKDNNLSVKKIAAEDIENVYNIISEWDMGKRMDGTIGSTDEHSAKELIKKYKELSVFGIIVYVDDIPFAVVAGFPLSDYMYDMCLAKQKSNIPGLSVYAKYQFVSMLDKKYKYINAEEDLGIEGLRIMKKQMQPIGQIKMFDGRLIENE